MTNKPKQTVAAQRAGALPALEPATSRRTEIL